MIRGAANSEAQGNVRKNRVVLGTLWRFAPAIDYLWRTIRHRDAQIGRLPGRTVVTPEGVVGLLAAQQARSPRSGGQLLQAHRLLNRRADDAEAHAGQRGSQRMPCR